MSTMTEDTTYQGWANYATWGVALILNNEEALYAEIRVTAQDYNDPENISSQEKDGIWTHEEAVRYQLEDYIKEMVGELCENDALNALNLMQQQVISAGLAEVDFAEIAQSFLED